MSRRLTALVAAVSIAACDSAALGAEEQPLDRNAKLVILTGGALCSIYIDGAFAGESPLSVFVTPGSHTVRAVPDAGKAKEKKVKAIANQATAVRFDYPLPKPVKAALKGDYDTDDSGPSSWTRIGLGVAALAGIVGLCVIAYNSDDSQSPYYTVTVNSNTVTLSVRSAVNPADGDRITMLVNHLVMLDNIVLATTDTSVTVTFGSGLNTIQINALNEGTQSGNAGVLTISNVVGGSSLHAWSIPAGAAIYVTISAP